MPRDRPRARDAPAGRRRAGDPDGPDGGFDLSDDVSSAEATAVWQREVDAARSAVAGRDLGSRSPLAGAEVTLRWIHSHTAAEHARRCGHADLLRERIDGATGV
ncbi:mycothiol transferase [Geodermatophilus sp. URMC 62]|uniref:mycothiol transferase n=1 Tax=Geodermatophilus sp. URMC 62 TaxID=3423414 RepID=UPI00406CC864